MIREQPSIGRYRLAPLDVPPPSPAAAAVVEAVDTLATDPDAAGDPRGNGGTAGADLLALLRAQAQLSAAIAARTAAFDSADASVVFGLQYTSSFLTSYTLLDGRTTTRLRHVGLDVTGRLAAVGQAWAAGRIGEAHVGVIRTADRRLAGRISRDPEAQATILGYAEGHTPAELQRFLRVLIDQYTSDGSDAEDTAAHARRCLDVSPRLDGWAIDGFLDPVAGSRLSAFLAEYATKCSPDDNRSPGQRRADALIEALDLAAGSPGCSPAVQVALTATADQLAQHTRLDLPGGQSVAGGLAGALTCSAGVDLMVVRLLADGRQVPLRMGRAARLASAAQRRALALRDRGCIHHGCTRPPRRCHAHHITEWENGGITDLSNLALLCPFHHAMLHLGRFRIVADPDHPGCFICVYPDRHTQAA